MKGDIEMADMVLGIICSLISIYWIFASSKFPGGTKDGVPGAGYFPIIVASVLILMSIVLIIQGFKKRNVYFNVKDWGRDNIRMLILTVTFIAIFFILWYFTSYLIACIVMTLGLGYTYKLSWIKNGLLSVLFSFGTYIVFNNLLHVLLKLR